MLRDILALAMAKPPPVKGENPEDKAYAPRTIPGNINLKKRKVVHNKDGTISTERSITIDEDKYSVVIPTVVNGKIVSNKAAIAHYKKTGQHLGKYPSRAAAEIAAQQIHEQQARRYTG